MDFFVQHVIPPTEHYLDLLQFISIMTYMIHLPFVGMVIGGVGSAMWFTLADSDKPTPRYARFAEELLRVFLGNRIAILVLGVLNRCAFRDPNHGFCQDSLITKIKQQIIKEIHPFRIYLFGSQAKGTGTKDSDIDLLIIADLEGPRQKINLTIRRLFPNRSFPLDVFVFTKEEFERQKILTNSISNIVLREGQLLYEQK